MPEIRLTKLNPIPTRHATTEVAKGFVGGGCGLWSKPRRAFSIVDFCSLPNSTRMIEEPLLARLARGYASGNAFWGTS